MVYVAFVLGFVVGACGLYAASLYYCLCVMRRENLQEIMGIILKDKVERRMGMSLAEAEAAEAAFQQLKAEQEKRVPDGWQEITA